MQLASVPKLLTCSVGRFKNPGRVWAQKSDAVNDHDFRSMADGVAIPYGIYDLQSNRGTVYVGTSYCSGSAGR